MLARHSRLQAGSDGPSWLTFLGHSKDSIWCVDLFRCESLILKSHWVMVVMDQFSRRITAFAVHAGPLDGPAVWRLFNRIINGSMAPRYLSSDNDPLFLFHQWRANLRILDVTEVKTVPWSHPLVERLIGTIRRGYLDQVSFWSAHDLERKLVSFQDYYNKDRIHRGLDGATPNEQSEITDRKTARLDDDRCDAARTRVLHASMRLPLCQKLNNLLAPQFNGLTYRIFRQVHDACLTILNMSLRKWRCLVSYPNVMHGRHCRNKHQQFKVSQ